ncbi:hypothetical protein KFE69_05840 [bacterium SCSIO 12844]|nr:hypothetical protein KFE69_05840 [bacterium SCSIO 12844]
MIKLAKQHPKYGVVLLRLDDRENSRVELVKLKPLFESLFGKDQSSSFDNILNIWDKIKLECISLLRIYNDSGHNSTQDDFELLAKENVLQNTDPSNDEITQEINQSVSYIEELCNKIINKR